MKNGSVSRGDKIGFGFVQTCFIAIVTLVLAESVVAQAPPEQPKSFSLIDDSFEKVDKKPVSPAEVSGLLENIRQQAKVPHGPGPLPFAVAVVVKYDLKNSGTWRNLPDGRLWRLRIFSKDAKSLNLGITRFDMPDGAKLWIYDPQRTHVEGPYSSQDRSHRGSLWTPLIEGAEIVVEVFVPDGVSQPTLEIGKVNHGYRGFRKSTFKTVEGSAGAEEKKSLSPASADWAKWQHPIYTHLTKAMITTWSRNSLLMVSLIPRRKLVR